MKKIDEINAKELYDIANRCNMTKAKQLIEEIKNNENEKKDAKLITTKGRFGSNAMLQIIDLMNLQKEFIEAGDNRKKIYGYITITVKNSDKSKAAKYINDVCVKMQEMDKIFKAEYTVLNCPDYDDVAKSYTDMISFTKVSDEIEDQRRYVSRLMSKAMIALR